MKFGLSKRPPGDTRNLLGRVFENMGFSEPVSKSERMKRKKKAKAAKKARQKNRK